MRLLISLLLAALPLLANASTVREVELACPIGGEKFKAVLAGSGYMSGRFLDMKPFGPIAAPWPIAKCPSNGFVMYRSDFSESELKQLTSFVTAPDYRNAQGKHTNYYLAAVLQRQLNEPPERIMFSLLQATWEANGEQYDRYAAETLEALNVLLSKPYPDKRKWLTDQLVAGELERRTRRFDDAKKRFSSLKGTLADNPTAEGIISFQLSLISEKRSDPQLIPSKER